jgi:hypothetical protein
VKWDKFYSDLTAWSKAKKSLEAEAGEAVAEVGQVTMDPIPPERSSTDVELFDPETDPRCAHRVRSKGDQHKYKFLIVYTRKRKSAKLHKAKDGCQWTKIELNDFTLHELVTPEQYSSRCKICWPGKATEDEDSDTSSPSE